MSSKMKYLTLLFLTDPPRAGAVLRPHNGNRPGGALPGSQVRRRVPELPPAGAPVALIPAIKSGRGAQWRAAMGLRQSLQECQNTRSVLPVGAEPTKQLKYSVGSLTQTLPGKLR